jgi:2-polyprenyl-3-methyl-5-hydroxy-6-metoxy-1,4-benzoquinol methylase
MPVDNQIYDRLSHDVGCGGGLLAEEFAELGCEVIGVDPSTESLAVVRVLGARLRVRESRDLSSSYGGYALKPVG